MAFLRISAVISANSALNLSFNSGIFAGRVTYTFDFTNSHGVRSDKRGSQGRLSEARPVHRSNLPWLPRSSDLTLCYFFMWGFVKSKVYLKRPANIPALKDRIRGPFAEITVEMRKKAALAYRERLEKVIENDGGHVEVHN